MRIDSQVEVLLAKGKPVVVEEVGAPGHPPVLHQVHRPQDEVDALAVLVPRPVHVQVQDDVVIDEVQVAV